MPGGMQVAEPYSEQATIFTKELVLQREVRPLHICSCHLEPVSQAVSRLSISEVNMTVPVMFGLAGHFVATICPFSFWSVFLPSVFTWDTQAHLPFSVFYSENGYLDVSDTQWIMVTEITCPNWGTADVMDQTIYEEITQLHTISYLFLGVLDAVRVLFPLILVWKRLAVQSGLMRGAFLRA